jgi:hypothetical protein
MITMKGVTTNFITFSNERSFLIDFIKVILQRNNKTDSILATKIIDLVVTLVTKAPKDYKPEMHKLNENQITFIIPDNKEFDNTVYYFISRSNQKLIETFVYRTFTTLFDMYMSNLKGVEYKTVIENFMDTYNISIDKYEMLKKRDYRERTALSEKTKKISGIINFDLSCAVPCNF